MAQKNYHYIEKHEAGLSIRLEFPAKTGYEEQRKAEIKHILRNTLNEFQMGGDRYDFKQQTECIQ